MDPRLINLVDPVGPRVSQVPASLASLVVIPVVVTATLRAASFHKLPLSLLSAMASSALLHSSYDSGVWSKKEWVIPEVVENSKSNLQIGESAGPQCKAALQETTRIIEQSLTTNGKAIRALFGASQLDIDGDFMYFLADAAVIARKAKANKINREKKTLLHHSGSRPFSYTMEARREIDVFVDVYVRHRDELAESFHESASHLPPQTSLEFVDPPEDARF
ncbi:serine protease EDA2 [Pyrus ussuriensis x Pyrus communis]|uniref:Serine protease EDA2 n=1 Tax=Pyrus ussuriensis x Pyrus communis TaxID=2448454 RepID=A0A5N5HX28_9ROSA|nr:serine protease EDA2 [Pyrus ussuriensis x Pyrus communis]